MGIPIARHSPFVLVFAQLSVLAQSTEDSAHLKGVSVVVSKLAISALLPDSAHEYSQPGDLVASERALNSPSV